MLWRIKLSSVPFLLPRHQPVPVFSYSRAQRKKTVDFLIFPSNSEDQIFFWIGKVHLNQSISRLLSVLSVPQTQTFKISCSFHFSFYRKACIDVLPPSYLLLTSRIQSHEDRKPPFWKAGGTRGISSKLSQRDLRSLARKTSAPESLPEARFSKRSLLLELQPILTLPSFTFENSQGLWDHS